MVAQVKGATVNVDGKEWGFELRYKIENSLFQNGRISWCAIKQTNVSNEISKKEFEFTPQLARLCMKAKLPCSGNDLAKYGVRAIHHVNVRCEMEQGAFYQILVIADSDQHGSDLTLLNPHGNIVQKKRNTSRLVDSTTIRNLLTDLVEPNYYAVIQNFFLSPQKHSPMSDLEIQQELNQSPQKNPMVKEGILQWENNRRHEKYKIREFDGEHALELVYDQFSQKNGRNFGKLKIISEDLGEIAEELWVMMEVSRFEWIENLDENVKRNLKPMVVEAKNHYGGFTMEAKKDIAARFQISIEQADDAIEWVRKQRQSENEDVIEMNTSGVTNMPVLYESENKGVIEMNIFGVQKIIVNSLAVAVITDDDEIKFFGAREDSGDTNTLDVISNFPLKQSISNLGAFLFLGKDGTLKCTGDARTGGDVPTNLQIMNNFVKIYATDQAFAALTSDGIVYAWGNPIEGGFLPADLQNPNDPVQFIASGARSFLAMTQNNKVMVWGDELNGGIINPQPIATIANYFDPALQIPHNPLRYESTWDNILVWKWLVKNKAQFE